MDLSFPKGDAINDYIDPDDCTIKFDSFDRAIEMVSKLGKGALMGKLDIKSAYRICPVCKEDWDLLGIMWDGRIFIDLCLAFGLWLAGNHFNQLADALCWLLSNNHAIENLMHYLDDFFLANEADCDKCRLQMETIKQVFAWLGVPLAPEKIIEPITGLVFLGILIDTITMAVSLPSEKLEELISLLEFWTGRKKCTKRELLFCLSLVNLHSQPKLSHQAELPLDV